MCISVCVSVIITYINKCLNIFSDKELNTIFYDYTVVICLCIFFNNFAKICNIVPFEAKSL